MGTAFETLDNPHGLRLSRRELLRAGALAGTTLFGAAALSMAPSVGVADEGNPDGGDLVCIPITDDLTIGAFTRMTDPEHWASLHPDVQAMLDAAPLFGGENSPVTVGGVGGYTWVNPNSGQGSSFYSAGFTSNVSCPGLAVQVTYSLGGYIYYRNSFSGAGFSVSGSGTVSGVPTGTYSVVATGYPTQPPTGYDVTYYQGFGSATIW